MTVRTCSVFEIVRGTTHDGPGMRTTVFLKGCPLICSWCQNPEGISTKPEIGWEEKKCIRCLECIKTCKPKAISEKDTGLKIDRATCTLCGDCVDVCPSGAMEFTAREWTGDALIKEVLKDKEYYKSFGGGVTLSGGEPLLQHEFVQAFLTELRQQNIHTALDTCGLVPNGIIESVMNLTDLLLFDLKFIDPELHKKYTGSQNGLILENLALIAGEIRKSGSGSRLWIRTPLIPEATASAENLAEIGSYIEKNLADVTDRWELCTFNRACEGKYKKLGRQWAFENIPTMNQETVDKLTQAALSTGFDREKLVVSGLTRK